MVTVSPEGFFKMCIRDSLVNVDSSRRYNGLLQDYQQVNGLLAINNRRQTYFKLYSKSHDEGMLKPVSYTHLCVCILRTNMRGK